MSSTLQPRDQVNRAAQKTWTMAKNIWARTKNIWVRGKNIWVGASITLFFSVAATLQIFALHNQAMTNYVHINKLYPLFEL